ncbi:MAG: hypothetical protein JG777_2676 [Clostridia bacterium]|uniref:hypothetical protein n=1 Tax=Petroclostridium xylanilyticum TaxID=1792311 RepID=UPI000B99560B|nr:hypothetical protein [Petroclostridium xylanilyticum]MBZ4647187.1 hypothetical protein [Clostridia bacterium]
MKKRSIIVLSMIMAIVLLFSTGMAFAATKYIITSTGYIDAYGYGCDFSGTTGATVNSNGYYTDVTGVRVRTTVYKNGIKVTDVSADDTTSPYSVTKSGACSSTNYSNSWKLVRTHYCKTGAQTYYTVVHSVEEYDSN